VYRGRLIFPFLAEIARLDTSATATAGGYDQRFREPTVTRPAGSEGPRVGGRRERALVRIAAQVEVADVDKLRQTQGGNVPTSKLALVAHLKDLARDGLIDVDGKPDFNVNDRLHALYTKRGELEQRYPNPPGMFCTEVRPQGFGIGGRRNMLILVFESRDTGIQR
jgi:hypothetical protein